MEWRRPSVRTKTTLLWDLTNQCNLRCKHCYNNHKYFSRSDEPYQLASYQAVIDNISASHVDMVHFLGGEPLLHPHVFEITRLLKAKGLMVGINTNGTFLKKYTNEILESGFGQVVVSLESSKPSRHDKIRGQGVFAMAMDGIRSMQDYDGKLVISWTLTKECIADEGEIQGMLELCLQNRIHTLIVNWLFNDGAARDYNEQVGYSTADAIAFVESLVNHWRQRQTVHLQIDARPRFIDYLNKKYNISIPIRHEMAICKGARSHYMLRANGDLFPCAPFDGSYGRQYMTNKSFVFSPPSLAVTPLKHLIDDGFFANWLSMTSPTRQNTSSEVCSECIYHSICQPCPLVFDGQAAEECKFLSNTRR